MSRSFVVIYEAAADFIIATQLADRALMAEIDWLEEGLLDSQRRWVATNNSGPLTWKSIPSRSRELGIRVHGHFNGEPGVADASAARRAIAYVHKTFSTIDAILLIRDLDDQAERRQGLKQARAVYSSSARIVIGVANAEREAWAICGFIAENDDERQRLNNEKSELGFDPCERSHALTAGKDDRARKSPKRVLAVLTNSNRDREQKCWQNTSLEILKARGKENGLADYLDEIKRHLVPLISGNQPHD